MATSTWTIDPVHTSVTFSVRHLGIASFRGRFREVSGAIQLDEQNPAASSVEATIAIASLDATNEGLMKHMMSGDFLEADKYPTMVFRSNGVRQAADGKWMIDGELELHGASRPVTLTTSYLGQEVHPFTGKTVAAFSAGTEIDRREWGLNWAMALPSGAAYLGEKVAISLEIEAVKD